ncbi:MAG: hypothetical protein BWX77_00145 [Bacteroidetes bacterium ADurb.Bin090]|nr:MAG: hypothetical protein BWX77_00145 [Bacteroidetes bacterium ADurb.Bin090]
MAKFVGGNVVGLVIYAVFAEAGPEMDFVVFHGRRPGMARAHRRIDFDLSADFLGFLLTETHFYENDGQVLLEGLQRGILIEHYLIEHSRVDAASALEAVVPNVVGPQFAAQPLCYQLAG